MTIEAAVENGRIVDLLASNDGFTAGIEIETGQSNALENVHDLSPTALDKIISVVLSKHETGELARALAASGISVNGRTAVAALTDFLKRVANGQSIFQVGGGPVGCKHSVTAETGNSTS